MPHAGQMSNERHYQTLSYLKMDWTDVQSIFTAGTLPP
jgi:hypothetical protein